MALAPLASVAAPYAALVMDARSGEVLFSENADSRLHPASLTKMMTLYVTFEAIRLGEISLDTMVTVSQNAASEPPSKLGLRAGQRIQLRYLIRAAAVKSANDAATAIGEAVGGSEAAFARRMNRTARALGMTRTTFRNANGLTEEGHLSTARDMAILGRHLFYDYPQYYNIFSRRSTDAGGTEVLNTNRRFLDAYEGADGIKTGYTRAAGFNLVASAQRGRERIIASVFGGNSTADRNAKMADLLDLGFQRAPTRVAVNPPGLPRYDNIPADPAPEVVVASADGSIAPGPAARIIRGAGAPSRSLRPRPRGANAETSDELLAAIQSDVANAIANVNSEEADAVAAAAAAAAAEAVLASSGAATPAMLAVAESTEERDDVDLAEVTPRPRPDGQDSAKDVEEMATAAIALAEAAPETASGAEEEAPSLVASSSAPAADLPDEPPSAGTEIAETEAPADPGTTAVAVAAADVAPEVPASATMEPLPNPDGLILAAAATMTAPLPEPVIRPEPESPEIVTRMSTSNGRLAGVTLGRFSTRDQAERTLITVSLSDMATFGGATRKVIQRGGGFEANFMGMTSDEAETACRRVLARGRDCEMIGG